MSRSSPNTSVQSNFNSVSAPAETEFFFKKIRWLVLPLFCMLSGFNFVFAQDIGTVKRPLIDSKMSNKEAFDGLDPNCPVAIRKRQKIVDLEYYSFDGKIHRGQLVIDKELTKDIKIVFKLAFAEKFPILSVIPISHPSFRKNRRWDDELSMIANNTSAFNYRQKTGGGSLSNHAYGRAIDINTVQNPYLKGEILLPPNGNYLPNTPGTLDANHPIVRKFIELGWDWGGNWTTLKDYQHFEKPLKKAVKPT